LQPTQKGTNVRLPEVATEITEADDVDLFLRVLDEAMDALNDAHIQFLFIGGIGSAVYGRDQGTRDIDVFVRPETARKALDVLDARGFETREVYEHWLSKAIKDGVLVDVIFRSTRDILLGEEMLERSRTMPFRGRMVPVAPPEDLVVMKASAMSEDTSRYWYDAAAIIAATELDWDYLVARARQHGARRLLSLLLFATSIDIVVPSGPIESLYEAIAVGSPA
jgi:predicted nucleotidyltransferase